MNSHYDVIIIGAGASGLMAACVAVREGKRVLVLEKNKKVGEKLRISGGGRCNITNAEPDLHKFLSMYGKNNQFLYSPFSQFSNKDTAAFFEELGLPLITQGLGRMFPHTEKAIDVCTVLEKFLKDRGVEVLLKSAVTKIGTEGDPLLAGEGGSAQQNRVRFVVANGITYTAYSYILATGGLSHPETGSTGDGFKWLTDLGHTVNEPTPSIVPLSVSDEWVTSLAGKMFEDAKITFFLNGKKSFSKEGRILATHFGLSGPTILNSAQAIGDMLHEGEVTATINLFPRMDAGAVDRKIIEVFDIHKNKSFKNVLSELVPPGMASGILPLIQNIDPDLKVHSVSKDARKALGMLLMALPVHITDLMGFDRAVIADGGIPLEEIDMKTMRSKQIDNLFITGDLLHVNRPSGGYSLQLCWTTGFVAGKNA
jgi:predicted Rossmann fold flavoprotein